MSDNTEIQFIDGLIVKAPRDNAPDFVKASLSIKRLELIAWLGSQDDEWINADIKVARSGKYYAAVNTWKPQQSDTPRQERSSSAPPSNDDFDDDSIPF